MNTLCIKSLSEISSVAKEFVKLIGEQSIIAFHAPMGAGKTTFIKAVCEVLGVEPNTINSPTFAIINEYISSNGEAIYHFDFYRITREAEALDIGLYDYLDSGSLCLIEWPENIEKLLPEQTLHVNISVAEDGSRIIHLL